MKIFLFKKIIFFIKPSKSNNSMNMWISFKVTSKSMNNSNQPVMDNIRISKIFFRILPNFMNSFLFRFDMLLMIFKNIINSICKFCKKISIIEEKFSKFFWNSKKDSSVFDINERTSRFFSPKSRVFFSA